MGAENTSVKGGGGRGEEGGGEEGVYAFRSNSCRSGDQCVRREVFFSFSFL